MASLVRRLTRNSTSLRTHLFPIPKPFPITHHNHLGPPKSDTHLPHLGPITVDKVELSLPVFPSFPFGYCLNPISQIGSERLGLCEADGVGSDDAGTIWADSVKKKRKRKMNKHKLRKLRKSLRRKT
ncbi:hypothetical protein RchiOBHm_Chr7g0191931 [Rosa chinensis]|uniref:Small ribosomal subunit protein mS38 n=1 Tax=Rosa chinensis TaxID=74649 RepID=A0A2P6P5E5_ROSCH|nr:uncharacterized protein LOC112177395 [Rosa chinensis]PRQ17150.1 hypothetical protein RchiOBHm_Chr7g0191931 [Rosa chinensis]